MPRTKRTRRFSSPRRYGQGGAHRWFDGKVYNLVITSAAKSGAENWAKAQRKAGALARVVREQGIWAVYVRIP